MRTRQASAVLCAEMIISKAEESFKMAAFSTRPALPVSCGRSGSAPHLSSRFSLSRQTSTVFVVVTSSTVGLTMTAARSGRTQRKQQHALVVRRATERNDTAGDVGPQEYNRGPSCRSALRRYRLQQEGGSNRPSRDRSALPATFAQRSAAVAEQLFCEASVDPASVKRRAH